MFGFAHNGHRTLTDARDAADGVGGVGPHQPPIIHICYTRRQSFPLQEVLMRRIGLAVILAVSLTLAPLAAGAQQTEKVRRIGFLSGTNPNYEVDDALFGRFSGASSDRATSEPHKAIGLSGDRFQKALAN